jgi:hypothetical protein
MNPVRSLDPAAVSGQLTGLRMYRTALVAELLLAVGFDYPLQESVLAGGIPTVQWPPRSIIYYKNLFSLLATCKQFIT